MSTRQQCEELSDRLAHLGHQLWHQGYFFGTDRRDGVSPGNFGDDATAGLGYVCQIAGELSRGVLALLDADNRYSAAALLRQLLELEYVAWWFETDSPEAAKWMRQSADGGEAMFRPATLRRRSDGVLDSAEYRFHCELGGHPTPRARLLLPCHHPSVSSGQLLDDLYHHLRNIACRVEGAAAAFQMLDADPSASES